VGKAEVGDGPPVRRDMDRGSGAGGADGAPGSRMVSGGGGGGGGGGVLLGAGSQGSFAQRKMIFETELALRKTMARRRGGRRRRVKMTESRRK